MFKPVKVEYWLYAHPGGEGRRDRRARLIERRQLYYNARECPDTAPCRLSNQYSFDDFHSYAYYSLHVVVTTHYFLRGSFWPISKAGWATVYPE